MKTIRLEVISAEGEIFADEATMVVANTIQGEIGITPGHTPLLASLVPGELRVIKGKDDEVVIYVSGGLLEIQSHAVTILADTSIRAENLDELKALEAKKEAERMIASQKTELDYSVVLGELNEAVAKLRAIRRFRAIKRISKNT